MSVESVCALTDLQQYIRETIGTPRYELWFNGNTRFELDDDQLWIGVPNRFYREWLEGHFLQEIDRATEKVFGSVLAVRFRIDPSLFQKSRQKHRVPEPSKSAPETDAPPLRRSRYTFSRFVAGCSNRVAYAATMALIEDPRAAYSPLYIYSGVGLGKTHLLKSLEAELIEHHRDLKVLALSCEEFTNQYLESMRSGKLAGFRRKFRQLDVLMVDDVQFLSGKRATGEEFLHTFNALEAKGAKVVLTCDVHPRRLTKVCEEIKSRFVSGMVAKIDSPNHDMRRKILQDKAKQRGFELRWEVLDYLAENLNSNVAELEGALNYLEHYCETLSAPLDLKTVRIAMADILRHSVPVLSVDDILRRACELFGISPKILLIQKSRSRAISMTRMLVLYLARKYTRASYNEIGKTIGNLNHSTVIAGEKRILDQIGKDGEIMLGDRPWKVRDAIDAFEREVGRG